MTLAGPGWVAVHAGARDGYQVPAALHEDGTLVKFVTDWYSRRDDFLSKVAARKGYAKLNDLLNRRRSALLNDEVVADHKLRTALMQMGHQLGVSSRIFPFSNHLLGVSAGKLATKQGCNILSASYYGAAAFRAYEGSGKKVLHQVHPSPRFLRALYSEFLTCGPLFEGLKEESEYTATEGEMALWEEESLLADKIIVSSSFSRASLSALSIDSGSIFQIPYGVDLEKFRPNAEGRAKDTRVLFVGSKTARKGLPVLLEAWRQLRPKKATLLIAGANSRDANIFKAYPDIATELPKMSRADLIRQFQSATLFVLPSLAEGFGHVYLEALACGTPILGTSNTAAPDLLRAGQCGFCVQPGSVSDLMNVLDSVLTNPSQLTNMRLEARRVAELHSWAQFRSNIRAVLSA